MTFSDYSYMAEVFPAVLVGAVGLGSLVALLRLALH